MLTSRHIFKTLPAIILIVTIVGCASGTRPKEQPEKGPASEAGPRKTTAPKMKITTDGIVEHCGERGLVNKILLLISPYCPKCKKAMPIINEIIRREQLELYFELLDLSLQSERDRLKKYNLEAQFVPTLIVDCQAHVGLKKRERYEEIIRSFKYGD